MGNFFSHLTAATTANSRHILLGCGNGVGLDMKIGAGYMHLRVLYVDKS